MTVVVLMKLIAKAVMMNECIRVRGMVCLITQRFLTRVRHGSGSTHEVCFSNMRSTSEASKSQVYEYIT
jgi:hypothetical protein